MSKNNPVTVGVVGCGTIATAVIRGIGRIPELRKTHVSKVIVNPRNQENAQSLKDEFPDWVTIAPDSQSVLNQAEVIFIGLHHKHVSRRRCFSLKTILHIRFLTPNIPFSPRPLKSCPSSSSTPPGTPCAA